MDSGGMVAAKSAAPGEPSNKINVVTAKMWARHDNAYIGCDEAVDKLPSGMFTIEMNNTLGLFFKQFEPDLDDLLTLSDSASQSVFKHIEKFWKSEASYLRFNVVWKRGVMLWGPPGSGKTTCVHMVAKAVIERGGIAVFVKNPEVAQLGLHLLRRIEPEREVVVIMEDIDAIVHRHSEAELLALLDGELQIRKVLYIATTNYPEKLDPRLMNRPSRFDVIQHIKMPSVEARRQYLEAKLPELASRPSRDKAPDRDVLVTELDALQKQLRALDIKMIEEKAALAKMDEIDALEKSGKSMTKAEYDKVSKEVKSIREKLDAENAKAKSMMDDWVEDTNNFSIAHLKELMLCVEGIGADYDQTVKRLKRMNTSRVTSKGGGDSEEMI